MGTALWETFLRTPGTFAIAALFLVALFVFLSRFYGGDHD